MSLREDRARNSRIPPSRISLAYPPVWIAAAKGGKGGSRDGRAAVLSIFNDACIITSRENGVARTPVVVSSMTLLIVTRDRLDPKETREVTRNCEIVWSIE